MADLPECDRFGGFADVLPETPSLMVRRALSRNLWFVVGRVPPLPGPISCSVLSSLLLDLIVLYLLPLVADVVMGIDGLSEKGLFSTSCTVNMAHVFASGIGAGLLLFCLCVNRCGAAACAVFAFCSASSLFAHKLHLVACSCPQFAHLSVSCVLSLHW